MHQKSDKTQLTNNTQVSVTNTCWLPLVMPPAFAEKPFLRFITFSFSIFCLHVCLLQYIRKFPNSSLNPLSFSYAILFHMKSMKNNSRTGDCCFYIKVNTMALVHPLKEAINIKLTLYIAAVQMKEKLKTRVIQKSAGNP